MFLRATDRNLLKSVHLEPDKAANDKARKDKLHEEWASRVIVDDPVFKVGGFLQKSQARRATALGYIERSS